MPRMVIVNDVAREHVQELLDVLEETRLCSNVRIMGCSGVDLRTRRQTDNLRQVQFKVKTTNLNTIVKELRSHSFGTFDVVDVLSSADAVPEERKKNQGALWSAIFPSSRDRLSTMEIHNNIVSSSKFSFDHVFLIFLASYIASIGLLGDSIVNILASFFVSPLMSMILACTWGIVINDSALTTRAFRNMVCGACLTWCNGAMIALLISLHKDEEGLQTKIQSGHGIYDIISINSQQIRDRGPPANVNLIQTSFVGALSGVSIALGQSSGISSTLTGVTVAASLLPPLVNSGLCTVFGFVYPDMKTVDGKTLHEVAIVSFSMYLVTVIGVMSCCFMTFKFKHVGGGSFRIQGTGRSPSVAHKAMQVVSSFLSRASGASSHHSAEGPRHSEEGRRPQMGTELIAPSTRSSFVSEGGRDREKRVTFAGDLEK